MGRAAAIACGALSLWTSGGIAGEIDHIKEPPQGPKVTVDLRSPRVRSAIDGCSRLAAAKGVYGDVIVTLPKGDPLEPRVVGNPVLGPHREDIERCLREALVKVARRLDLESAGPALPRWPWEFTFTMGEPAVQTSIRGATQMFVAPWGLAAQGSGQLRILPLGASKWQTVHQVAGDSLYRIAFDDAGRLLAWWEKEPYFYLFVPGTKAHQTFELPPPPGPEFKYGYGIEDMYFTRDGQSAIVYMHGFIGGRTWVTVAYRYDLASRTAPVLLFRQPGYVLHTSLRGTVHAIPKKADDACEHNFCHPLGAIIAWEISGESATRQVLLDGKARREDLSRVQPVWPSGGSGERIAVLVTEHPFRRHLLRWRWGDRSATFAPVPPGPAAVSDAETMWLTATGDVVEVWLTGERGLEIRRHPPTGTMKVSSLAPLPRRTPNDHPLFDIAGVMERASGDLFLHWGEYLVLVPVSGPARRLDLRTAFRRKSEISSRLLHVRSPEGIWVGIESGKNLDMTFLPEADLESRMTPAP